MAGFVFRERHLLWRTYRELIAYRSPPLSEDLGTVGINIGGTMIDTPLQPTHRRALGSHVWRGDEKTARRCNGTR